jgi:hypothetical protein
MVLAMPDLQSSPSTHRLLMECRRQWQLPKASAEEWQFCETLRKKSSRNPEWTERHFLEHDCDRHGSQNAHSVVEGVK